MGEITQAVFLSCSSPDAAAAGRLCEGLRAAGLEVWFDRDELRGGEAWDATVRRQIRDCALFIPVISAHSEARGEGYFRLEWRLAVERSHLMADDQAYLFPVVIDDTLEATARVPDRFRERQWTRLVGGATTPAFIEQVKRTLAAAAAGTPSPSRPTPSRLPPAPARTHRKWKIAAVVMAVVLVALTVALVESYRHRSTTPQAPAGARATAAPEAHDPKAIAVLPFVNLTGRAEDAYLADGLQEEILSTLARVRDLKVISRTSTAEFRGYTPNVREVADRLGVGSLLEGSVRREGRKLRLTVQLIDTRNDRHVLAADYDRDMGHILGLQAEVARKIADALSATLTQYERGELDRVTTNSGDAYDLYLRALVAGFNRTPDGPELNMATARELLEQALRRDPEFLEAAALLSQACNWMYFRTGGAERASCARKYYERALALDPKSPEALLARGLYEIYVAKELDQAILDLGAVVRVRPNSSTAHNSLGFALRRHSRFDEGLAEFKRAWDLDPLSIGASHWVMSTLMGLRRYPELVDQMKLFQRRFPSLTYFAYIGTARAEAMAQHSLEPLRRALREHGNALDPESRLQAETELARDEGRYLDAANLVLKTPMDAGDRDFRLGFLYWAAGKNDESQRRLRAVEPVAKADLHKDPGNSSALRDLALVQSMLGEHAAALASIDAARALLPESQDPVNGPELSFMRSMILVRAGHAAEGAAEVARLLPLPFGAPVQQQFDDTYADVLLMAKDDPRFDEILRHPPRL